MLALRKDSEIGSISSKRGRARWYCIQERKEEIKRNDEKYAFLESEIERIRDDRDEQKAYCQRLYETSEENEEYYATLKEETKHGEAGEDQVS